MPRKKNVSTAPEEPLAENQEVQVVPAGTGETEGLGFPTEAETADLPPEAENAALPSETGAGDFPPEAGADDFPPGEDPYPDGGAVGGGEEPAPVELDGGSDGVPSDGDAPVEDAPPAEEGVPKEDVLPDAAEGADTEYDALLHEWSETNGAQAQDGEGGDDPLILAPPPGMEPDPFPEPEESAAPLEEAPADGVEKYAVQARTDPAAPYRSRGFRRAQVCGAGAGADHRGPG